MYQRHTFSHRQLSASTPPHLKSAILSHFRHTRRESTDIRGISRIVFVPGHLGIYSLYFHVANIAISRVRRMLLALLVSSAFTTLSLLSSSPGLLSSEGLSRDFLFITEIIPSRCPCWLFHSPFELLYGPTPPCFYRRNLFTGFPIFLDGFSLSFSFFPTSPSSLSKMTQRSCYPRFGRLAIPRRRNSPSKVGSAPSNAEVSGAYWQSVLGKGDPRSDKLFLHRDPYDGQCPGKQDWQGHSETSTVISAGGTILQEVTISDHSLTVGWTSS